MLLSTELRHILLFEYPNLLYADPEYDDSLKNCSSSKSAYNSEYIKNTYLEICILYILNREEKNEYLIILFHFQQATRQPCVQATTMT